jgi:mannose-6-phosphate isomerase-like protein (cupin superfamily)
MSQLIKVIEGKHIFAIVLRKDFNISGPSFFTPGEFSQQLGMLIHPRGKVVERHRHKLVRREILRTQEVLVLLEGRVKVDLYNDRGRRLRTVILKAGDAILLARGGHRIKVLADAKIVEVKQGPYAGFDDKEFF